MVSAALPSSTPARPKGDGYIVSPVYDVLLFLLAPLGGLLLAYIAGNTPPQAQTMNILGRGGLFFPIFSSAFSQAHLVAVMFRSHANPSFFHLYPWRFVAVPLLLLTGMLLSAWVTVLAVVVARLWDAYHSSMQTFGLGRIYELRAGNNANAGRNLDVWLNHFLYIGPLIGGVTLAEYLVAFKSFEDVGVTLFTTVPAHAQSLQGWLAWAYVLTGIPFLGYYVWSYRKLHQAGHVVSQQKVMLLCITGVVTILSWGFNPFGYAVLTTNFFHALQYFGIVWCMEGKNLKRMFGLDRFRFGYVVSLLIFLGFPLLYGFVFVTGTAFWSPTPEVTNFVFVVSVVVSLMHFWYDGFIWSARKGQV